MICEKEKERQRDRQNERRTGIVEEPKKTREARTKGRRGGRRKKRRPSGVNQAIVWSGEERKRKQGK